MNKAIVIGNSDGIGLGITKRLLELDWKVAGISRSGLLLNHANYSHITCNVLDEKYTVNLKSIIMHEQVDLLIFCVGIGELLNKNNMDDEVNIIEVNFLSLIKTLSQIVPHMLKNGSGHIVGLSSLADDFISVEAPSYNASKAGFSNYIEGLALALKPNNIFVTNVRFGFVDTKMAKSNIKPFMISTQKAVDHLIKCIEKKPIRYSAPKIVLPLVWILKCWLRFKVFVG